MCDTADGPAGWQSTVDAAWQPHKSPEQEKKQEENWRKDSPSRSEHNICPRGAWNSLELALAECVYVCLMRSAAGGGEEVGGGVALLGWRRRCSRYEIRDRYEGHERTCVCMHNCRRR